MNLPPIVDMLRQLIAAPSISSVNPAFDSGNLAVIERLEGWLSHLGFAIEVLPLPGRPGKADLIATLGSGPGGLVLAGHTDTVPCDEGLWRSSPFTLTEREGRFYGLGSSDMKGFFALALAAAAEFSAGDLRRPLIILATADEESSMEGAKMLVELGRPKARYAIIGEPTGLRPINAHKGVLMEAIRVLGRSGHSSNPALGVNAMEGMHKVIGELLGWRQELQRRHHDGRFAVPQPTLNLGHIHGGDNPNRICGHCELHIDLRLLPGMGLEETRAELKERVEATLAGTAMGVETHALFPGAPPLYTPADSPLVRVAEQLTGHPAEAVAFCTEGPYLQSLGMETIILGPGDIEQAHQPDEYLALDRVRPTVELLRHLIHRFCIAEQ